jgi:hypothetical protein
MICYKDKTFCPFWEGCKIGSTCHRALTDKVKRDAEAWMEHAPISQYMNKPPCFEREEE